MTRMIQLCILGAALIFCVAGAMATNISDDFEDGVIDASIWTVGGYNFGVGGLGSGSYTWTHSEVIAADGYLDINLQGPTSANTYGGYAYAQTIYNYNDGDNHLINFTWGADVNASHIDHFLLQLAPTVVPANAWLVDSPYSLYDSNSAPGQIIDPGQQDLGPTNWSVLVNSQSNSASLYSGADGTGSLLRTISLDSSLDWYFTFIHGDGTSAGYPETDNSLLVYSYNSMATPVPEPATIILLSMGLGGLAARRMRKGTRKVDR